MSQAVQFDVYFFFNDTATTEIYTLSLHDALPIWRRWRAATRDRAARAWRTTGPECRRSSSIDRKSTRLNSSHITISYAVFCLKKKSCRILHQASPTAKAGKTDPALLTQPVSRGRR